MAILEEAVVLSNQSVGEDLWEMEMQAPNMAPLCEPGQFLQIRVAEQTDPLLRRPISIYDVQADCIRILYRVVGTGTRRLSEKKAKDRISLQGPLGKGFHLSKSPEQVLLVGGGVGIAPLLFLARRQRERGSEVTVVYGAANQAQVVGENHFTQLGVRLFISTLDGSYGIQGMVTDILQVLSLGNIRRIYTCGPEPMMKAVTLWAREKGLKGEVSMESHMACGVGACLGCACKLNEEDTVYKKVCKDGPVFSMDDVYGGVKGGGGM